MASFACILFVFCLTGPVLCVPTGRTQDDTSGQSSDDFGIGGKKHYKVVTIPDDIFVLQSKTGAVTGPYIFLLNAFADVGNFSYDITTQADKNFGKKQADGKFNGMIGDTVNGKYDVILANTAFTKDISQVLSGAGVKVNVSEWTLFNPRMKSNKKDYIVRKNLDYFLLKHSDDSKSKAIWANIKARMPASIVANGNEAVKQVKAGKYFVTGDQDSLLTLVNAAKDDLAVDPSPVFPNIPVYSFATKKGAQIGSVINALWTLLSDDEGLSDTWTNQVKPKMIGSEWTPSPSGNGDDEEVDE